MGSKKKTSARRLTKKEIRALVLDLFERNPAKEFDTKHIFETIGASTHPAKMLTMDVLRELVLDDYLSTDECGHYRYAIRSQVMEGTFKRKRNGRNSFLPDDGGKSILVCERNSGHAMDGDRVRVTMLARRSGHTREAEVIEILKRARESFVGKLRVDKNYGFLITEGRALANDIFIPKEMLKGGKTGDKAVVKIIEWPDDAKSPIGKVIDILGHEGENNAEMHAILAEYGLPYTYPKAVEAAAEKIPADITEADLAEREDMRGVTTFTIDPRDAKDFDDALSIRRLDNGLWEVGVHIADVSHYVKEGDIIDREAQKRATSVYLVDRTIPMLPERLCNFICSLRPDEDKLAFSAIFQLNDKADVMKWHLAHTVIRSDRRFVYEEVQNILEQNGEASEEDLHQPGEHPERVTPGPNGRPVGEYATELIILNRLAKQLRAKRFAKIAGADIEELFEQIPGLKGAALGKILPFEMIFKRIFKDGKEIHKERIPFGKKLLDMTIFPIEEGQTAGLIVQDVTKSELHREIIAQKAQEVLRKNILAVQEVAGRLGENIAETEIILNYITEGFGPEKK